MSNVFVRLSLDASHQVLKTPRWISSHKDTAPLLQRAWVYQERSLAPRTVHLHANETVWSCRAEMLCECKRLDGSVPDDEGWGHPRIRLQRLDFFLTSKLFTHCGDSLSRTTVC
ncbi:hypothetical protein M422DRAFT_269659 [Sphaerobolus stellatus SS14]|uniref:Uncharacterized protein n=1 Tax=Sphaerobolus stellatus (strain SS14) TaxID=990650 RepID=A0A0C9U435_SPHS4|nr:hypothetical protein M422DRAFT_269659 [Sphaerobolus stellatus SS14]